MKARKKGIYNFNLRMKTFFTLLFISFCIFSYSQEYDPYTYQEIKKKPKINEKLFFGGGFGLQFGTYTSIKFTPEIGYRLTEKADVGVGLYYLYSKNNFYHYSDHIYGGKIFSRFYVTPNFFLTGEYESLNIADYDLFTGQYTGKRIFIDGLPLGIGWRQQLGDRFAVLTTLMYNVLQSEKTPYSNPIFRVSFIY